MANKSDIKTKDEKKSTRCSKCGRDIKNINKKFDIEWPNGSTVHCCSNDCNLELSNYKKKYSTERMAFIAQLIFGIAGIISVLMQYKIAAQIFIAIDAIIFLVFPHAIFNPRLRASYDETKRQSRNIATSLLMFVVIWFYFLYKSKGL